MEEEISKKVEDQITSASIDIDWIYNKLVEQGMDPTAAAYIDMLILAVATFIIAYIAARISRNILIQLFNKFATRTTTQFDDLLVKNHAFRYVARLVPFSILVVATPIIFSEFPDYVGPARKLLDIYLIIIIVQIVRSIMYTIRDYLQTTEAFRDKPVQSYIQVVLIFTYLTAGLIIFSSLTGKSVWAFLTALGAASAVLLLIFRDTILGFVASIQVASNDIVRIGDWIEMPKYGADGDVIEINLATVKVQNWDKTITTIPTYALISDSFKNWRAMQASGGRRIKRSINIKISSIRHVSPEDMERLAKVQHISEFLHKRHDEIEEYNKKNNIDTTLLINGRHMTNLGVFRQYIEAFIKNHPDTHKDMTMMVRHLEPTTKGIPIELYTFADKTEWVVYEGIIADMFDHLLASVKYFGLQVYEEPASDDVRYLREHADKKEKEVRDKDLTRGKDIDESKDEGGESKQPEQDDNDDDSDD